MEFSVDSQYNYAISFILMGYNYFMPIDLYHYLHCPFCIRVRLVLGLFNLDWSSHVLSYDDEETPVTLTGKKMLPIARLGNTVLNESLDIIKKLDHKNSLKNEMIVQIQPTLDLISPEIYNLGMPFWIWSTEFTEEARCYFLKKKEAKRGPFPELMKRRDVFEDKIQMNLLLLEKNINPFYLSKELTIQDIALASQLWGLYSVPEFRFSDKWHNYLMTIKQLCRFTFHDNYWRQS
jgi:glutaredoxin 2